MKDAWKNYYKHAWGYDFLNPLSRKGENLHGLGYTIIDSLDTLLIMDLDDEFQQARKWVNESMAFGDNVSFFEAVIRCVGGLMSAYELTKDQLFLEKAVKLGTYLCTQPVHLNAAGEEKVRRSTEQLECVQIEQAVTQAQEIR